MKARVMFQFANCSTTSGSIWGFAGAVGCESAGSYTHIYPLACPVIDISQQVNAGAADCCHFVITMHKQEAKPTLACFRPGSVC